MLLLIGNSIRRGENTERDQLFISGKYNVLATTALQILEQ
jgi:hypothetical protein